MEEQIVKIQRRKVSAFVTIPIEYVDKIKDVTHMRVWENEDGNLEYKAVKKGVEKEVE